MSEHAKLSPSSAARWMRCPGSVALSAQYPDTAGFSAEEGTFAHLIASKCLEDKTNAKTWLGSVSRNGAHKCTEEMRGAVQHYLDAVRAVMLMAGPRAKLFVEQRVALAGVLTPIVNGTADAIVFDVEGGMVHVFDFKYGAGVFVEVDANEQAMIYATGALVTFAAQFPRIDMVAIHIVQPRHAKGAPWRSCAITKRDLCAWADEVLLPAAIAANADKGKTLVPSEKGCQWCNAKAHCPALRAQALEVAKNVFVDVEAVDLVPVALDVSRLTLDDVGRMLGVFGRVEAYMKAVRERAFGLAKAGTPPTGYKLVATSGNRQWIDDAAAVAFLRTAGADPFEPGKLVSPAQAEKRLGKKRAELVARYVTKPTTGATLAPLTDKRPALSSMDVFTAVTE